jgi:glycosyltransferase involved in cell wall biosynthesis
MIENKNKLKISVIIPTYNRTKELRDALYSVLKQTISAEEVIIVDDSDDDRIKKLISELKTIFKDKHISLKYIRNKREKSLAIARNIGIENSVGDIILFLDDDVVLDEKYSEEILKVYEEYPAAFGVQGHITNIKVSVKIWNMICKVLFLGYYEENKCRVLPSGYSIYPHILTKVISCQWLSGSNSSYKREILEEFQFDENLKKYSSGEDEDLSYRIFKKYPSSLFMTPYAKLIHKTSQEGRIPKKERISMSEIYRLYFFYKNIDQTFINKLIFLESWMGSLIMKTVGSFRIFIIKGSKSGLIAVKYTIGAYVICMTHLKQIKRGDLEFFNRGLR